MQIDSLPAHVVVIGATNHAELLDRAVWRRFQVRMTLPEPTRVRLSEWFANYERRIKMPLGYTPDTLAKKLYGVNFAEAGGIRGKCFSPVCACTASVQHEGNRGPHSQKLGRTVSQDEAAKWRR